MVSLLKKQILMLALIAGIAFPVSAMDQGASDASGLISWKTAGYVVGGYVITVGTVFAAHYAYTLWNKPAKQAQPMPRAPQATATTAIYTVSKATKAAARPATATPTTHYVAPSTMSAVQPQAQTSQQAAVQSIQEMPSASPNDVQHDDEYIEDVDYEIESRLGTMIIDGKREQCFIDDKKPYSEEVRAKYRTFYELEAKAQKEEIVRLINEYVASPSDTRKDDILKHVRIHQRRFGSLHKEFWPTLFGLFNAYTNLDREVNAEYLSTILLKFA